MTEIINLKFFLILMFAKILFLHKYFTRNKINKCMEETSYIPPIFIGHGGGPLPILGDPEHKEMISKLKEITTLIKRPKEIVVVSAHWETNVITILDNPNAGLLYDYSGFPEESYNLNYPIKISKTLNEELGKLFDQNSIQYKIDKKRDFDHGVFIPLMLMYPEADIPVAEISILNNLDPNEHIRIGKALCKLAYQGVFIIGSGMSFHNMSSFFSNPNQKTFEKNFSFNKYLVDIFTNEEKYISKESRMEALEKWKSAEGAKFCQPREEHLVPLFVISGASPNGKGIVQEFKMLKHLILNVIFNSEK